MNNPRLRYLAATLFFAGSLCVSQENPDGTLIGSTYRNDAYRFSMSIPAGWEPAPEALAKTKASVSDPNKVSVWLAMQSAASTTTPGTKIILRTQKFDGRARVDAEIGRLFVTNAVKATKASVLVQPVRVIVGGVDMFRISTKETFNGEERYSSLMAVGITDRIIVFSISGMSEKAVDEAALMLMTAAKFQPDWSVAESEFDQGKTRVRVSMGVSQGLLQKKVTPKYPVEAREKHIQGSVVVNALISRKGEIQRIWVVEGPPELAAATVEAVKQWKYKPYFLNGEPVLVETKIVSNYELRSTP
jgi:TonB family protein